MPSALTETTQRTSSGRQRRPTERAQYVEEESGTEKRRRVDRRREPRRTQDAENESKSST